MKLLIWIVAWLVVCISTPYLVFWYTPDAVLTSFLDQKIEQLYDTIQLRWEVFRTKIVSTLDQIEDWAASKAYYNLEPEKFDFVITYLKEAIQNFEYRTLTVDDFETDNPFAIVQMDNQIIITVTNAWTLGQRNDDAFEYLSSYIFGNNSRSAEIAMTSPVTRFQIDASTYETAFIVPDWWTMETLPEPNTDRITIKEIPWSLMAVWRFSGNVSSALVDQQWGAFQENLISSSVVRYGLPILSQYDGPWVLWSQRRNELWVHLNPIQ